MKNNAFKNPVIGALMLGNTKTKTIEIHAHSHILAVVSAITCVVLVLATGAGSLDMVGRLGINELQAVKESRVKQAIQLVKVFMLVLVPTFI
tara:strand:- start:1314 stop:1589 length:276 start_codon:yes stop_codon:yes gene_type:complete